MALPQTEHNIRLTSLSACAGCASKLSAAALTQILRPVKNIFDPAAYPDLLIGLAEPDDAAVWRLSEDRGIVVTTDFFTPVVDTPYEYGAIAAANSISDIYAMGGQPFLALNIAALPEDLPTDVTGEILRGGAEKALEAGIVIAGGHTVKSSEPKYGLVVIGFIDPRKMMSKGGFRPGDALVLTKPLGTGVINTAAKQEKVEQIHSHEAIQSMMRLNKTAGQLATEFDLRGGTDVTGFSLLGHGTEVSKASNASLHIEYGKVPFMNGVHEYAKKGTFPGGAFDNKKYFEGNVQFDEKLSEPSRMLLFDPQTSGGLLLGVSQEKLKDFQSRANELNQPVWVIGEAREGKGIQVRE